MKKVLWSLLLAIISLPMMAQANHVSVSGNTFVDENGDAIIFRGLCASDPVKLARQKKWNEKYFAEAESWGANVIRFAIHPENINKYGWDKTLNLMDEGIGYAKKHNMYVIIDWHSIGNLKDEKFYRKMYNTSKEETFRFWSTVAKRYKDEPTVALYELFNEPTTTANDVDLGNCTWDEWRDLQEQIIDTIRAYNPYAVCLCAGFDWAYDLRPIKDNPIRRSNIGYVCHPYPMKSEQPWEPKWDEYFGYVTKTYPVVCTEIGFCLENEKGAHIPVISTEEYGLHMMKYLEENTASFTVWCFDVDWAPTLITDWKFNPSTQGRFFKFYMSNKKKNSRTARIAVTREHYNTMRVDSEKNKPTPVTEEFTVHVGKNDNCGLNVLDITPIGIIVDFGFQYASNDYIRGRSFYISEGKTKTFYMTDVYDMHISSTIRVLEIQR